MFDQLKTVKLEHEIIVEPDPRARGTYGTAFGTRASEVVADLQAALDRALAEHGQDARSWPAGALDEIARLEARQRALDLLASRARQRNVDWDNTPIPPEVNGHG